MKFLKIMQSIGYFALFLGAIFNIVNQVTDKTVFGLEITMPLMLVALAGIVCGIIFLVKSKRK